MNRREAVRRIAAALGGPLSAPTLSGLLAGCASDRSGPAYAPRALTPAQYRRIGVIAELILPETDTPGARAAGVPAFIDAMLADFHSEAERTRFLAGLGSLDEEARTGHGRPFDDLPVQEQAALLAILDGRAFPDPETDPEAAAQVRAGLAAGDVPFMRTMKELTVAGYYTSAIGQTVELHQPPFGEYRPDVPLDEIGRTWA